MGRISSMKYGGDRGDRDRLQTKQFVFCLSRFGMTEFVITETLLSGVFFKTIMVALHRGRFVVIHLYSVFSVDPQCFPIGPNLYQKLRFWGCRPTFFKSQNGEIWYKGADLGLLPKSNFGQIGQIYTKKFIPNLYFWANLCQKLPIAKIGNFWYKLTIVKFGVRVRASELLLHAKFCKNRVREKNLYQKYQFCRFDACKPKFLKLHPWSLAWG